MNASASILEYEFNTEKNEWSASLSPPLALVSPIGSADVTGVYHRQHMERYPQLMTQAVNKIGLSWLRADQLRRNSSNKGGSCTSGSDGVRSNVDSAFFTVPVHVDLGPLTSLRTLVEMTAQVSGGRDVVTVTARSLLLTHIMCQPSVHDIFFPTCQPNCLADLLDDAGCDFDTIASLLVCLAIARGRDRWGVYALIDETATERLLQDAVTSTRWKKMGE